MKSFMSNGITKFKMNLSYLKVISRSAKFFESDNCTNNVSTIVACTMLVYHCATAVAYVSDKL